VTGGEVGREPVEPGPGQRLPFLLQFRSLQAVCFEQVADRLPGDTQLGGHRTDAGAIPPHPRGQVAGYVAEAEPPGGRLSLHRRPLDAHGIAEAGVALPGQ